MTDKTDSKEREALVAYLQDCDEKAIVPDVAGAWHAAFQAGRASIAANAGSEPVANNRPSLEAVFRGLSDRAYCNYIEQMGRNECLGWEYKVKHGKFGQAELKAHTLAGRLLGRHHAFAEAANALRGSDAPLTHPSPPEGMVGGWMPIETAPKDGTAILLGSRGGSWIGKWLPVYVSGYRPENPWSSLMLNHDHMGEKWCKPTHWMPLPPPPTSSADRRKGE